AFGADAGFYSGLVLTTCVGLFLFTRFQIPDAILTLAITVALWSFMRVLDPQERRPQIWTTVIGVCFGAGLLLRGLIAILFPIGAMVIYMALSGKLLLRQTWKMLHPFRVFLVMCLIAVPWYVLATLRNPPYFEFSLQSGPGQYHGFFWFYFIN